VAQLASGLQQEWESLGDATMSNPPVEVAVLDEGVSGQVEELAHRINTLGSYL